MKILIEWSVNVSEGSQYVDLEELNVSSVEEWETLTEEEQRVKMQDWLDSHDLTFPIVD